MSTPPGAATQSRPAGKENAFTRKIGPLPMWVWVAIAGALLIGWAWYENRQNSQASSSSDTANASDVPQFVNQTYTTVQAPAAPGSGSTTPPITVGPIPRDPLPKPPGPKPVKKPVAKKPGPKKKPTTNNTGGTGILGKGGSVGGTHGVTKTTGPTRKPTGTTGTPKGTTGGSGSPGHHVVAHPVRKKTNPPVGTRKVA